MHTVHTGIIILILKVITSFFLDPKKDIFVLFGLVTTLVSNFFLPADMLLRKKNTTLSKTTFIIVLRIGNHVNLR